MLLDCKLRANRIGVVVVNDFNLFTSIFQPAFAAIGIPDLSETISQSMTDFLELLAGVEVTGTASVELIDDHLILTDFVGN